MKRLACLFVVMVVSVYGYACYWTFWPFNVVKIEKVVICEKAPIHPGDVVHYQVFAEKFMDVPAIVTREVVNEYINHLSPVYSHVPTGRDDHKNTFTLRKDTIPGKHTFLWRATYNLHPLRTITVNAPPVDFMVVK